MSKILDRVNFPDDLKALSLVELQELSSEIREYILLKSSVFGGHVGSNLGIIELTIALHYVFDAPVDKIIFDTSHQCYAHKILTGRKIAYIDQQKYSSVSGFTNPSESEYDLFSVGHTSTAISLACGLAKARDLQESTYNVIAVVGDGALSGGIAFEGLNNAATLGSNLLIIINDNDMSIAENHGGLYKSLNELRETKGKTFCNIFHAFGFDYRFVQDGNNLNEIINTLFELKNINRPTIAHFCTSKGKGYFPSEQDREGWHYVNSFNIVTGKQIDKAVSNITYENITRDYLSAKMRTDSSVVLVTAGTPKIFGFDAELRKKYPKQFIDVGIAEGHAVAFVDGIAKNGGKPVLGLSSSFLTRGYDQLLQELAINRSPAVILIFFAGISCGSQTHMGIFDIPLIANIPNVIFLAPTCIEEYFDMLEWGLCQQEAPVVIRVPGIFARSRKGSFLKSYALPANYETVQSGERVAILALGNFFSLGEQILSELHKREINGTLINPRYISDVDVSTLKSLEHSHSLVITLEDGIIEGGFGERIARFYENSLMKVLNFGAHKEFVDFVEVEKLYDLYHLTADHIVSDILNKGGM